MFKLTLPSMVAGRDLANTYVDKFDGDLRDAEVVVDAYRLISASPSFSAELVHRVLTVEGARALVVRRPTSAFVEYLEDAADREGLRDRLVLVQPQGVTARL